MTTIDTYGSIDNLLETKSDDFNSSQMIDLDVYEYLVLYEIELILIILNSDSNKTSKHDLQIIKCITSPRFKKSFKYDLNWINTASDVLEFYKNRKK